jgi:hypothetical protein
MNLGSHYHACEVCGKWRGNGKDHTECSRVLKEQGPKKERANHAKFDVAKMERQLAYFLEDRGETPPYLETALDYRTLERLKNGG